MNARTAVRWALCVGLVCAGCGPAGPYQAGPLTSAPPTYSTVSMTRYTPSYGPVSSPWAGTPYATPYSPAWTPQPWSPQQAWMPQPYPSISPPSTTLPYFGSVASSPTPASGPQPAPAIPSSQRVGFSTISGDATAAWAPWPMPPRGGTANSVAPGGAAEARHRRRRRPLNVSMHPGSRCEKHYRSRSGLPGSPDNDQIVDGASPSPDQDLHYRGGKTLQSLSYVNLYVSGEEGWSLDDVAKIDRSIAAAMADEQLNNVLRQYFNNQPIVTRPLGSHPLQGYRPQLVTRGDVQNYVEYLAAQGYLARYDLGTTVFNFLLPPGTLLSDGDTPNGSASAGRPRAVAEREEEQHHGVIPDSEAGDSRGGLGGYHGSVHIGGATVYFSVEVYSERRSDGTTNGIPVFAEPWKNVVATLYHELQEARTDPDVEDAIRNASSPGASRYLGWTSNQGEEVGDLPLHDGVALKAIIREVPLTDGSGVVPVQLAYSNAVHGPEGPIPQPHPQPAR